MPLKLLLKFQSIIKYMKKNKIANQALDLARSVYCDHNSIGTRCFLISKYTMIRRLMVYNLYKYKFLQKVSSS